jgi:hypothetical protein
MGDGVKTYGDYGATLDSIAYDEENGPREGDDFFNGTVYDLARHIRELQAELEVARVCANAGAQALEAAVKEIQELKDALRLERQRHDLLAQELKDQVGRAALLALLPR